MLLSLAWGKVIHEKNLKQKISWHCPFKLGFSCVLDHSIEICEMEEREITSGLNFTVHIVIQREEWACIERGVTWVVPELQQTLLPFWFIEKKNPPQGTPAMHICTVL